MMVLLRLKKILLCVVCMMPFVVLQSRHKASTKAWDICLALIVWCLGLEKLLTHTGVGVLTNVGGYLNLWYFSSAEDTSLGYDTARGSEIVLSVPWKVEHLAVCLYSFHPFQSFGSFSMSSRWSGPSRYKMNQFWSFVLKQEAGSVWLDLVPCFCTKGNSHLDVFPICLFWEVTYTWLNKIFQSTY